jgi:hypothetical protein
MAPYWPTQAWSFEESITLPMSLATSHINLPAINCLSAKKLPPLLWSLTEMCQLYLGQGNVRQEIDVEAALKTWATTKEGVCVPTNYQRYWSGPL